MDKPIERNAHDLARTNPEAARGYLARRVLWHGLSATEAGEIWRRVRDGAIVNAFDDHVYMAHPADFEVCENPRCKTAYALEREVAHG